MKKTFLALALGALLINNSYASESKIKDSYIVNEVHDEGVTVSKKGNENDSYTIPKNELKDLDVKKGDELIIESSDVSTMSDPSKFQKIYSIKESQTPEKVKKVLKVLEINEDGVLVSDKENTEEKYLLGKDQLGGLDLKKDDLVEIITDDIILTSDPGQFANIYQVKLLSKGQTSDNINDKSSSSNPKTGAISTLPLAFIGLGSVLALRKTGKKDK